MEAMLAAVRAADQETLYSLYFADHGHVKAAAVAGCVCLCLEDHTCTECERILGVSFLAIERAARKKQCTGPSVPVACVDAGPGSHGVQRSDAVISGMVDRLGRGSRPPSDGVEGADVAISSIADRPGRGSHPPSDGIEGSKSNAAISSMSDRLGQSSNGLEAAISGMEARLVPISDPPSDRAEGSDAEISGTADRLGPGSHPPSDGIEGSEAAISDGIEESEAVICSMADRLAPVSNGVVEGFEAGISGMATRLGLAAAVGERAKEVFRKMEEARAWPLGKGQRKGRSRFRSERPLVYAACLSIACRAEGSALLLRELALAASANGGVAKKDIAWLVEHISRRLGKEETGQSTGISMVCVSSYVRRFGALVGLREAEAAVALEAARRLDEGVVDVRHKVDSVAAAVVCVVLERAGAKRPGVKDVAAATGVSHGTINTVCRKVRAHDGLLFG